jgi:hypothetical protein
MSETPRTVAIKGGFNRIDWQKHKEQWQWNEVWSVKAARMVTMKLNLNRDWSVKIPKTVKWEWGLNGVDQQRYQKYWQGHEIWVELISEEQWKWNEIWLELINKDTKKTEN